MEQKTSFRFTVKRSLKHTPNKIGSKDIFIRSNCPAIAILNVFCSDFDVFNSALGIDKTFSIIYNCNFYI